MDQVAVERDGQIETYAAAREMQRIPITIPGGEPIYIGDADAKWAYFNKQSLSSLGVEVDLHWKMPDLVVSMRDKNRLVLMEAASSHGPVDAKRYNELAQLFKGSSADLVYISCFPDRKTMRKYLADIAWETEVWCADAPSHMVHFNGERFLGPYQ